MLSKLRTLEKICEFILNSISALGLIFLVCITTIDVGGRFLFNSPLPGSTELTELILGVVIFSVLPHICWKNENIIVDVLYNKLSVPFRNILLIFKNIVIGISLYFIGNRLMVLASRSEKYTETTELLEIPIYPFIEYMALMSYLTVLFIIVFGTCNSYCSYMSYKKGIQKC